MSTNEAPSATPVSVETPAAVPEAATVAAPAVPTKAAKSKLSKKTIALGVGVLLILFIMASFNKRISKVQKRNAEIIKILKGVGRVPTPPMHQAPMSMS
jgi:hypothetical protein